MLTILEIDFPHSHGLNEKQLQGMAEQIKEAVDLEKCVRRGQVVNALEHARAVGWAWQAGRALPLGGV